MLFDRISLGQAMFDFIQGEIQNKNLEGTIKALYIDGSIPVEDRENARKSLETTGGNILLGQSSILSTGINIKNLKRIVLLTAGKAQARIIQAIGRTLRLSAGKTYSELVDVELNYKYSKRHSAERRHLYKTWYGKDMFDQEFNFTV